MASLKSFKQDPAKALWREKIVDFVRQHYTPNQIRNFRVLCFAGKEMTEVFDVYDELGVKRKNVVSLECDRAEFAAQSTLNDSLEKKIKVVPASALDYFSQQPVDPFDIISLDYCGYFNDEKNLILDRIALHGWLAPRATLVTNYLKGRETRDVRNSFEHSSRYVNEGIKLSTLTAEEFGDLYRSITEREVEDFNLADTREVIVQTIPIQKMFNGSGFWNTSLFRTWINSFSPDTRDLLERIRNDVNDGKCKQIMSYLQRVFEESANNSTTKCFLLLLATSEIKQHILQQREAYAYVSDSGTPMISDFYLFKQPILPPVCQNHQRVVNYFVEDGGMRIRVKDDKAARKMLNVFEEWVSKTFPEQRVEDMSSIERIVLRSETEREGSAHRKNTTTSEKSMRGDIYVALSTNIPDTEIMSLYNLTKMQLAGYKAAYTRQQNPKSSSNFPLRAPSSPFAPDDLEVITSLLEDGHKATAIVELFQNEDGTTKYSWQSIAAYKATLTKSNGALSNERLFNQLKPQIMERDGHVCQWCPKDAAQQQQQSGHAFHIHHVNYDHDDTRADNLVTLCTSCHARTNTIQHGPQMREYFELLMTERYSTATSA